MLATSAPGRVADAEDEAEDEDDEVDEEDEEEVDEDGAPAYGAGAADPPAPPAGALIPIPKLAVAEPEPPVLTHMASAALSSGLSISPQSVI